MEAFLAVSVVVLVVATLGLNDKANNLNARLYQAELQLQELLRRLDR